MPNLRALRREIEALKHANTQEDVVIENIIDTFEPYPWQQTFFKAEKDNKQLLIMAANQVGKSITAAALLSYHLTGLYPDNWEGFVYDDSIICWALGVSADQIREVVQFKLLGKFNEEIGRYEGGYIPENCINYGSIIKNPHLKGCIKEVKIQHVNGEHSTLSFKSYEQGQKILMGQIVDLAWIDEEPKDATIYPQILMRTINGDKQRGGHVILTFTPENGTTELVHQFVNEIQDKQYLQNVTWDDAPHLTEENKKQLLAAIPPDQREMRSKGIPLLGSGAVYPIMDDRIYDDLHEMPDYFAKINSIDFGVKHCGLAWLAYDRDTDIIHVYNAMLSQDLLPEQLSLYMRDNDWTPWAWPHDGHLPDRSTGDQQKVLFEKKGVNMLATHATHLHGGYSVEAGVTEILSRMKSGKIKFAKHLECIFKEKRLYHREKGKIVKKNDHVLDAIRYGVMMIRYAVTQAEIEGSMDFSRPINNVYGNNRR